MTGTVNALSLNHARCRGNRNHAVFIRDPSPRPRTVLDLLLPSQPSTELDHVPSTMMRFNVCRSTTTKSEPP